MPNILKVDPFVPQERSNRVGIVCSRGGVITVDTEVSEYFKILHVATGGDIIVVGPNGEYIPRLGMPDGASWAVDGNKVVSSATIGGVVYTTTCDRITWGGGS